LESNALVAVVVVSITDNGLKAHPSEPPCMSSPCGMGDTDDDICDDMSRHSMIEETVGFKSTTGRSVRFGAGTKDLVMTKSFERQTTVLPHVMAHWKDATITKRVSIRIQLLSGYNPVQLVKWRVSTDQKVFINGVRLYDSS
jgi:hypothetical protein